MQRVIIWSLAVRALHFAFAGSLLLAIGLAFAFDDEHPLFRLHMLAGMFAGGALALRILLGVIGGRHARFRDWPLGPSALRRFVTGLFSSPAEASFPGHNPAAAWVMTGMFAITVALVGTGLNGGEDIHEAAAWGLIALIGAHLGGLALHSLRHRENIALAMVDGRKRAPEAAARSGHGWAGGTVVLALLAVWGAVLWRGYDAAGGMLRLPGLSAPLRLGESEGDAGKGEHHRGGGEHEND